MKGLSQTESIMSKDAAYRTVARHIFVAHQIASKDRRLLIILADGLEEAERRAKAGFGVPAVHVKRIIPTEDVQIYKI